MATIAALPHQPGGPDAAEVGSQAFIPFGQLLWQAGRTISPCDLGFCHRGPQLDLIRGHRRHEPCCLGFEDRRRGRVRDQREIEGLLLFHQEQLVVFQGPLPFDQLAHLVVHGLEVTCSGDAPRPHPLFDVVATLGRCGDLLLELSLANSERVDLDLDLGGRRHQGRLTGPHVGELGSFRHGLDAVAQLVQDGVVLLDLQQCVVRLSHRSPRWSRRGS